MGLLEALRDARAAARAANEAESAGRPDWKLCWEACRCWCVAAGLAKTGQVKEDYGERAWSWAKKAVEMYETIGG